jgi:hypothetical protein
MPSNEIGVAKANKTVFRNITWSRKVNTLNSNCRTTSEQKAAAGAVCSLAESANAFKIYPYQMW